MITCSSGSSCAAAPASPPHDDTDADGVREALKGVTVHGSGGATLTLGADAVATRLEAGHRTEGRWSWDGGLTLRLEETTRLRIDDWGRLYEKNAGYDDLPLWAAHPPECEAPPPAR